MKNFLLLLFLLACSLKPQLKNTKKYTIKKILAALIICFTFFITQAQLTEAVDFTVVTTDKDTFNLYNQLSNGNFVFMEFGARWCGPCRRSIPVLNSLWNKYYSDYGCFFLISFDVEQNETTDKVKQYKTDYGMPFPMCAMDSNSNSLLNLCHQYTAGYSIPEFIMIKPDRSIPYVHRGGIPITDTIGIFAVIDSVMKRSSCSVQFTEINNFQKVIVSPNPFSTQLTFTVSNSEPATITLYDIFSRQVLQQAFSSSATLNTEPLAAGIYFYELRNDKGVVKKGKVVRQ